MLDLPAGLFNQAGSRTLIERGPGYEKDDTMGSKLRAIVVAAIAVGALTFTAAPAVAFAATGSTAKPAHASAAQAAQLTPPTAALSTTFTDATGAVDTFTGTFTPTHFTGTKTTLTALGTVTGAVTNAGGVLLQTVNQQVAAPAAPADPTCNILSLVLGPLNLNLLGLVVTLNQVVLNITAVSGAGNLLGNLLCAVANLLNNTGTVNLTAVANLLNRILSLL